MSGFIFILFVAPVPPGIEGSGKTEIIEVIENHTAYLSCPTSGIPQPSMMWLKNGVPLADVPYSNMRELHSGHQLEVRSVRVADEGLYKCQANNVAGQKFKNFKLKVLCELMNFSFKSLVFKYTVSDSKSDNLTEG